MERTGIISFHGNGLTLLGDEVKTGQSAPDFEVLNNGLNSKKLSDFKDKVCVILSVPSLDTPVCDIETRRFNEEAANFGNDVEVLVISMDLPFAQARWCGAAGIENVLTLSDHKQASFGQSYGVLIKELRLLARAVFIVDAEGVLSYIQIVPEITEEPDYEAVLEALKGVL